MTAEPGSVPESVPRLTAVTVTALQDAGFAVETDWEQETFDIVPGGGGDVHVAGVMLHASRAVAFYVVWGDVIPIARRAAVAEWSVRANTDLATCVVEFSLDSGILGVRSAVHLGPVVVGTPGEDIPEESLAISRKAYGAMVAAAVDDAAATFARLQPPVTELVAG